MKTHNTVSIQVDGLEILATARAFSVGREWRTDLDGVASRMREAIGAARTEAARRDACDPEILRGLRRPTAKDTPAMRPPARNKR